MTHPAEGTYPHVPAAFINAIAEEGTKAEAVEWLQKLWNENCALRSQGGKASMTSANLAALIHEARFPEGKDAPNYIPFLHEDRSGREYCLRIARKIIETVELAAAAPSPSTGRYKRSTVLRVHALVKEHGWRIHPNFTEALMGFPSGWSAIEGSETPSPPMSPNSSEGR